VRYILPLIFVRFLFLILIFAYRLYYNIISCVYKILYLGQSCVRVYSLEDFMISDYHIAYH